MKNKTILVFSLLKILEVGGLLIAPYLGYLFISIFGSFPIPFWSVTGIIIGYLVMIMLTALCFAIIAALRLLYQLWISANMEWAKKITKEE